MDRAFPCLHVVTDTRPGRMPLVVVRAAVAAARRLDATDQLAVQVRVQDEATDRQAYELTVAVLEVCRSADVRCLVNDRLHIALAAGADGGHVGADDLPVAAARAVLDRRAPRVTTITGRDGKAQAGRDGDGLHSAVLGATCRTPQEARAAVAGGATYLGVGPVFATATKDGLPPPIGVAGVAQVARAVPGTPVVAIAGITAASVPEVLTAGAYGVAVVGALSAAADPEAATAALLTVLRPRVPA